MNTFKGRFFTLVCLQLFVMASLIVVKQITLRTGERILLKAIPVDPRELFRGDYVALSYEISHIPRWTWGAGAFQKGDTVYVTLQREGRFWVAQSADKSPPEKGVLFLQGRVAQVVMEPAPPAASKSSDITLSNGRANVASRTTEKQVKEIAVEYGIESYFLPTKQAEEMGRIQRGTDRRLIADVVVDSGGHAVLRGVLTEKGKPKLEY